MREQGVLSTNKGRSNAVYKWSILLYLLDCPGLKDEIAEEFGRIILRDIARHAMSSLEMENV